MTYNLRGNNSETTVWEDWNLRVKTIGLLPDFHSPINVSKLFVIIAILTWVPVPNTENRIGTTWEPIDTGKRIAITIYNSSPVMAVKEQTYLP